MADEEDEPSEELVDAALDLFRRLPPHAVTANLQAAVELKPALTEELLARVDQPLVAATDPATGKAYLMCDYNRDGDSYRCATNVSPAPRARRAPAAAVPPPPPALLPQGRAPRPSAVPAALRRSPWSNAYYPPLEDGTAPSETLRSLEVAANNVFAAYREQYYEGGVSSVYLWDGEEERSFAGCFLIHKASDDGKRGLLTEGYWDAIHVVEAQEDAEGKRAEYKLTSTVMLHLATKTGDDGGADAAGNLRMSGSLTRQEEQEASMAEGHLVNIGVMIEEMEAKLRSSLDHVYFAKTQQVVSVLRRGEGGEATQSEIKSAQTSIMAEVMKRQSMRGSTNAAVAGATVLKPSDLKRADAADKAAAE